MGETVRKNLSILAVALCAYAAPASAASNDSAVAINARVRTVCTADFAPYGSAHLQPGINPVGHMTELCNAIDGYRLVLDHPSGLIGAAVLVDGRRIPLQAASTRTVIVDSAHPGSVERELSLELSTAADVPALAIYAEPKGAIF